MKHFFICAGVFALCMSWQCCLAWDGFDADTTDLIEIIPDDMPIAGSTIDVRDYDTETTQTCLVESVTRNRRTIEVVVRTPEGAKRTLVMEGR